MVAINAITSIIHIDYFSLSLSLSLSRRAKLFRFDPAADPPEWKERGTGDVKFLRKRSTTKHSVRLLMRRDKTHKICANHYCKVTVRHMYLYRHCIRHSKPLIIDQLFPTVTPDMKLMPSAGSDRAFVWNVQADFADEEPKPEQLAIRFKNAESKFVKVCVYCSRSNYRTVLIQVPTVEFSSK